jgi:hypothetical protein
MLQELRILLNGVQVLTAFLILLPFNQRFHHVPASGKWVYVATFLLSISCIVFFSAPPPSTGSRGRCAIAASSSTSRPG